MIRTCLLLTIALPASAVSPLLPVARWPLPTTYGVFNHSDHLIRDPPTNRVFASAKNIDTVFVLDGESGALLHALPVHAPQGQGITRGARPLLWVGSDGNGILSAFDLATLDATPVHVLNFSGAPDVGEADDILIDDVTGDVLVAVGDDAAGSTDPAQLATVSAESGQVLARINVPGHIEGFDFLPGTDYIIANIPDAGNIVALLDRHNSSVVATFSLPGGATGNVPLAYDPRRRHVMLGVHNPPSLIVLDLANGGAQVFAGPAPSDLDDSACARFSFFTILFPPTQARFSNPPFPFPFYIVVHYSVV